ncbi:MAG: segregation/condensation protein A [Candidatus Carbobacillus altaicus]|uniref:Segregation and condensation protein A n=1 Tax=Candidatus Carbonibacillus altaicus TaxID=2163959 RepID=A0A2R6XZX0_9BACL|nr:segregation/condensation protein A [Candidatus Carbobacillus altaicus]PTQ55902.1 MAG: Segregation and condensation protein A [Candidatus Carbobacillus altaicus]PTQ55964.1 MAG: Segregation and condensation protein A [Candidatus Carbobacillus altaicus]
MTYIVHLDAFEGPLDLLLHLVQKAKMDIYDIEISRLIDDYLAYLEQLPEMPLDMTSAFLYMAATLLNIKSRALLPQHEKSLGEIWDAWEEDLDPRDTLIARLVEYRRFKAASEWFKEKLVLSEERFSRPPLDLAPYRQTVGEDRLDGSILALYIAYQSVLEKNQEKQRITYVENDGRSLDEVKVELIQRLKEVRIAPFTELVGEEATLNTVILTFMALLILIREQKVRARQRSPQDAILVWWREEERSHA